jgi:uncharacterized protein (TIGR02466 family)
MEAAFAKFGPLVLHTRIDENLCKKIFKLCNKKNPANHKLVGHIKDQHDIDKIKYVNLIKKPLDLYMKAAKEWYDKDLGSKILIQSAWVNYMKAGEFNPPHTHSNCYLSSVLFLETPKGLAKERATFCGNGAGPGILEFIYGEDRFLNNINMNIIPQRGDICIFPANVRHQVAPFKCKGTRVSVAANFVWE